MSTISPQESQWYKEFVTPFQPQGRSFLGYDLRGTQCDRFGNGNLRLTGYGDSSGGYAFTPANQDAAIAPSLSSANLSNIANSIPRLTEQQDFAGKWIDTITLHALDEFIEQTQPQSFIANTLRLFIGGQRGYRGDGTGKANIRNTYTLLAEIPIPALSRADIPRSFNVKAGVYVPPAQNLYLGLAIPQPYTCSFEMWDLQANTLVGSGVSASIGGSSTVADGNDLIEDNPNTPVDTQFVLPITFASATWRRGVTNSTVNPPPPTPLPISPTITVVVDSNPSKDRNPGSPSPSSPSSPTSPSRNPQKEETPPTGCVKPVQGCEWYQAPKKSFSPPNIVQPQNIFSDGTVVNVGPPVEVPASSSVGGSPNICPKGTIDRGFVQFASEEFAHVLCCTPATYPPNGLGCAYPNKWSCSAGGVCVVDALGTYNSLAECQAALIPPQFNGGQCVKMYSLSFKQTYADGSTRYYYSRNAPGSPTSPTLAQQQTAFTVMGPVSGFTLSGAGLTGFGNVTVTINGVATGDYFQNNIISPAPTSTTLFAIVTVDGSADNCGDPPSTCP